MWTRHAPAAATGTADCVRVRVRVRLLIGVLIGRFLARAARLAQRVPRASKGEARHCYGPADAEERLGRRCERGKLGCRRARARGALGGSGGQWGRGSGLE